MTASDIKIITGNTGILIIAPHGHRKNDENTAELAAILAEQLKCYAVINHAYQRPPKVHTTKREKDKKGRLYVDLNRVDQAKKHLNDEYLQPIIDCKNQIKNKHGAVLVIVLHGAADTNVAKEGGPDIDAILGTGNGQQNRLTCSSEITDRLVASLKTHPTHPVRAMIALKGKYSGWDRRNINQLFTARQPDYYDEVVQSIQFEIKYTGFRDRGNLGNTAKCLASALEVLVEPREEAKPSQQLPVIIEDEADDAFVERCYNHLAVIFSRHFEGAMREAGQYLIQEFYGGDINLARQKKPTRPKSNEALIHRLHSGSQAGPSKSWIYNAIKLVIEYEDVKTLGDDIFHTYGNLLLSHKVLLFPVADLATKGKLIREAAEKGYTVADFRSRLAEISAPIPAANPTAGIKAMLNHPKALIETDNPLLTPETIRSLSTEQIETLRRQAERKRTRVVGEIEERQRYLAEYDNIIQLLQTPADDERSKE